MRLIRYLYPPSLTPAGGFRRSPWSGLETEMDRLFETALSGFAADGVRRPHFPVDLYEDEKNTYVRAELPGLNRADINVEMNDGYLTISAPRKAPVHPSKTNEQTDSHEEESCLFSRAISIADELQADKVSAAYENGVLTVTLPKREAAKPKKITVAVK